MKKKPTEWQRIYASYTANRELIHRVFNKLRKHRVKNKIPFERWAQDLNRVPRRRNKND